MTYAKSYLEYHSESDVQPMNREELIKDLKNRIRNLKAYREMVKTISGHEVEKSNSALIYQIALDVLEDKNEMSQISENSLDNYIKEQDNS